MTETLPNRDRLLGISMAVLVHAFFFTVGGLGLMQKAEYGMDASFGSDEVDLIAAPAPMTSAGQEAAAPSETPAPPPIAADPEDIAQPSKVEQPAAALPLAAPNAVLRTSDLIGPLGDGSSPIAGMDATTRQTSGTGGAYAKPGYYRNPPPHYPDEAKRLKQEGRVSLRIRVSTDGHVLTAHVQQSSGFSLLDEAAVSGVQSWRFRPARVGGMAIESDVDVPVRFQLK